MAIVIFTLYGFVALALIAAGWCIAKLSQLDSGSTFIRDEIVRRGEEALKTRSKYRGVDVPYFYDTLRKSMPWERDFKEFIRDKQ